MALSPHNEAGKAVVALVSHYLTNKLITVCQPKALTKNPDNAGVSESICGTDYL
ncbi:hypothetical protein N8V20_02055 [Enterobacter hormaechei subsp. steigerwaltii]|nr:hypothetical protein [Enterobacter hormaechei subsp. steigerwaltii]MCU3366951.1 hypothetical protein [Enterobacter hormaechei subsp. steigerwaltii]